MDESYKSDLNYCNFHGVQTEIMYTCFKDEICCEEGCCPKGNYGLFRMWYIWFILLGLLFACSGGLKLFKSKSPLNRGRVRSAQRRRESNLPPTSPYVAPNLGIYFESTRLRNPESEEDDRYISIRRLLGNLSEQEASNLAIDNYLACQSAREAEETTSEPPSYSSLQNKLYSAYDLYGPPPQYDSVCKPEPSLSSGDFELAVLQNAVISGQNTENPDGNTRPDSNDLTKESVTENLK